jgi:hypothetical protein
MTEQSNARSKVIAFVKFCREESHADQFISGSLHMNRLRYFQKLEASEKDDGTQLLVIFESRLRQRVKKTSRRR